MSDNDLIRRGDALAEIRRIFNGYPNWVTDAIAALPAVTVGVYECAGCGRLCRDPEADLATLRDKGAISCCPERHMEPVNAPDPVALLRDVPRYEPDNPLDNAPSMKADPQGDWLREADVLAAQEPVAAPDPAAIRDAALREALDCCTDYGFTRADECRDAILALIQKGGDAHDKTPIDARPETSPGVTAGAISKGAADDR